MNLSPKLDLLLPVIGLAALLAVLLTLSGCGRPPNLAPPGVPQETIDSIIGMSLDEARAAVLAKTAELSAANSVVDELVSQDRQKELERLRKLAVWVCGIAILAGAVCAGLAVWLRSKMMAGLALACLAVLAVGLFTGWLIAHAAMVAWVVGLSVLGVIGWLLWQLWEHRVAVAGAVRVAEYLKPGAEEPSQAKSFRRAEQARLAGRGRKVIDDVRARVLRSDAKKRLAALSKVEPV